MTLEQLIDQLEDLIDDLPEDAKPFKTLFKSRLGAGLTLEDWNGLNTQLKDILATTTKPSQYEDLVIIMKNVTEILETNYEEVAEDINELQTIVPTKVDKITGKNLSTEDFTTTEKNKLGTIESGAQVNDLETIVITGYGETPETALNIPINNKNAIINLSLKADLIDGVIPASQVPGGVDAVIEVANFEALPRPGLSAKIYITLDNHKTYRWGSTDYAEISASLTLGETESTAYRGDRGKDAYEHSTSSNSNPHGTNINQLAGTSLASPNVGQVIKWNGTAWAKGTDNDTNYYFSNASFDTATGVLTLTGAGGQGNLTPDLDGRYYITTSGRIVYSDIDVPDNLTDFGLVDLVATKDHLHTNVYAPLVNGKIPDSYLPPLAITKTHVVADQNAQNTLVVEEGDVAVRTDLKKSFIYTGTAWQELLSPTDVVLSVNGQTGVINLTAANVGAASIGDVESLTNSVTTFIGTTYATDKLEIGGDILSLENRAATLETDSHNHTNKSVLDGIVGIQTSITSESSTENNQLATIGAIKNYVGNPDSTWEGQANFLRDITGDHYPSVPNTPDTVVVRDEDGNVNIGYDNSDSTIVATTYKGAIDELDLRKADVSALTSNIKLYPTTANADVSGYKKMVSSLDDSDYNTTAVDIPTGTITTTGQLIASLVSSAGLFVGNPGVISLTTIGKIKKTAGNENNYGEFYFEVYKRSLVEGTPVETLQVTSDTTGPINFSLNNYREFSANALLNNGIWTETDRVVIKYYANALLGTAAEYSFEFGGANPVRTLLPVPVSVIPSDDASGIIVDASGFTGVLGEDDVNVQHALETLDTHNHDGVYQLVGDYATNTYVNGLLAGADAMIFKGTIGTGGTVTSLPTAYNAGWTYKVITAGTYAANNTEVGDMLLATVDRAEGQGVNGDWAVIQTNIDGSVTGPTSSVNNQVAIFDGVSGKIIKDSGFTLGVSVPTDAVFTDTVYTHPTGFTSQPETALTGANVISQVTVNDEGHMTGTSTRALTPSDIGAATNSDLLSLENAITGRVLANPDITGATHTKITYDAKGLVTAGGNLAESDVPMLPIDKITNLQTALDSKLGSTATAVSASALIETRASTPTSIWTGTQAQYDAIGTKSDTTLYFITE